jgi:hypothetical protein
MKYRIEREAFVVGGVLIPAGTIVDTDLARFAFAKGKVPPLNAVALDQTAYDVMHRSYCGFGRPDPIHPSRISSAEGVVRKDRR